MIYVETLLSPLTDCMMMNLASLCRMHIKNSYLEDIYDICCQYFAVFFTFFSYSLGFSVWSTAGQISTFLSVKHLSDEGNEGLCILTSSQRE